MGLDTSIQSPAYLQRVCIDLAQKASAERELLEEDEDGYTKLSVSKAEILRLADNGYRKLDDTYPYLWGGVWADKAGAAVALVVVYGDNRHVFSVFCGGERQY